MHKPESLPENMTDKILWDFQIQTHPLIPVRRPDLVIVDKIKNKKYKEKKKTCRIVDFSVPEVHLVNFKENQTRGSI